MARCRSSFFERARQVFVIVILTPRISPLESICTLCLLPLVRRFRLAAKPERFHEHLDLAAAGGTLQIAEDVAALLAPVAGDAVALAGDVAREVELVAVAGAVQVLLQAQPAGVDLVVGLAADVLGRAVGERRPCRVPPQFPSNPANGPPAWA